MAKKSENSNKKGDKNVRPRRVLSVVVVVIVVLLSVSAFGFIYLRDAISVYNIQNSMREYLQNKYNQEFLVEKPERKGSGLAVEGHIDATAYPKSDESIRFTVVASSSGMADGYAGAVWTKSENERLKPIISDIFGEHVEVSIEVKTFGTARGAVPVSGTIPSFSNGAERYGSSILYTLYIKDGKSIKGNESEASTKVYRLLPSINSSTDIIFSYRSQMGGKSYGVSLDQDKIKEIKNVNDLNNMYKEW